MSEKPTYSGPDQIPLPRLTKLDVPIVSETPSGVHRALSAVVAEVPKMKRSNLWTKIVTGAVGAAVTAVLTFFFARHTDETKEQVEQVDTASLERQVKVEQRLADHIDAENQRHTETQAQLEQLKRGNAKLNAKMDLELDTHHVPRSKRPIEDDDGATGESR